MRILPKEYRQLEYLTSENMGPYIQLNYGFDITDEVEIKTKIINAYVDRYLVAPTTWNSDNNRFAMGGAVTGTGGVSRCIGLGSYLTGRTKYSPEIITEIGQITTETYSNRLFTITGENINSTFDATSVSFGSATDNLKLFYGYNATTQGCIYYWKHKKVVDGVLTLVEDLIPAKRISDSELGMYDLVSKQFFTNSGTGRFIAGPIIDVDVNAYDELEYIQSSGTQWIDTNLIGNQDTAYEIQALTTEGGANPHLLFGARSTYISRNIATHFMTDIDKVVQDFCHDSPIRQQLAGMSINKVYTFYNSKNSRYIIDTTTGIKTEDTTICSGTFTTPSNLLICNIEAITTASKFVGNIYYCKIWDNGTLVRNLIPVRRYSDSAIGMVDTLTDTFYANVGTGTFIPGPSVNGKLYSVKKKCLVNKNPEWIELPDGYTQLEYIYMPPGSYINTSIIHKSAPDFEMELQPTRIGDISWFGNDTTTTGCVSFNLTPFEWYVRYGLSTKSTLSMESGRTMGEFCANFYTTTIFHKLKISNYEVYLDNVKYGTLPTQTTWSSNAKPLLINKGHYNNYGTGGNWKYFKISENGTVKFNGIPAKDSDGVLGMYDLLSGNFFTNAGTDAFTAGPEIPKYTTIQIKQSKLVINNPDYPHIDGYTPLDYIQSSGTQYIDTNYYPDKTTSIDYIGMQLQSGEYDLFGTSDSNFAGKSFTIGGYNGGCLNYGTSNTVTGYTLELNVKHKYTLNKVGAYIDDVKIKDTSRYIFSDGRITRSLTLMATNWSTGITEYGKNKCYNVKLSENGILVHNFIPAKRNSGDALGMYDLCGRRINMLDGTRPTETGKFIHDNGTITSDASSAYWRSIPVKPNTTYTISNVATFNGSMRVHGYDSSNNWTRLILKHDVKITDSYTITTGANEYYLGISGYLTSLSNGQIEEGSTATPYEPYDGFYTNAGTGTFTAGNEIPMYNEYIVNKSQYFLRGTN